MFHVPLNILSRRRWGAEPPVSAEPLKTPADFLMVTFTESRECFTKEDCMQLVKELQAQDMQNGLPDIRFNFLLGGDGFVYEGRGWKVNNNKENTVYDEINGKSVDFAYIGPSPVAYQRNYPSLLVKLTKARLIEHGIQNRYISISYNVTNYSDNSSNKSLYALKFDDPSSQLLRDKG